MTKYDMYTYKLHERHRKRTRFNKNAREAIDLLQVPVFSWEQKKCLDVYVHIWRVRI